MYRQIVYGNFTFGYNNMTVVQTPRYGDSGIDQTGIKYDFRIRGWIQATTAEGFNAILSETKAWLAKPRQSFTVRWSDDNVIFTSYYSFDGTGDDIAWGPMPGPFSIMELAGGRAALFEWSLTVETKQCYDNSCNLFNRGSDILTISRKFDHNVGPDGLTTRTISGRLEVTTNAVVANRNADYYRWLVTPSIPTNFERAGGGSFVTSADGRFLDFSITDKEVTWTLPPPITSGQATWSVSIQPIGLMAQYRLSGRFSAPPSTPKSEIINQIMQLASNRFPALAPPFNIFPDTKVLEEDVYGNSVSFVFTAHGVVGANANPFDPTTGYNTFGSPPPGSDGNAQFVGPYGGTGITNSGVMAASPTPYDACTGASGTPGLAPTTGGQTPTNTGGGGGTQTQIIIPGTSQPSQGSDSNYVSVLQGTTTEHAMYPWLVFVEKISWEVDNQIRVRYPKIAGAAPLVQQVANPKLIIIQAGYATRMADSVTNGPSFPMPLYNDDQVRVLTASQETTSPPPIGASMNNRYSIAWCYKMQWLGVLGTAPLGVQYSQDPRRPTTASNEVLDVPVVALPSPG